MPWPTKPLLLVLGLALGILTDRPAWADENLNQAIITAAKTIYERCKENKIKTLGVLKFQVVNSQGHVDDNIGPIHLSAARRLEIALIFAHKTKKALPRPEDEVLILRNASDTVNANPSPPQGWTYLTPEGRQEFFKLKYKPYWGSNPALSAEAFVRGKIRVSTDLKKLTVDLRIFQDGVKEEIVIPTVTCDNSINDLVQMGQSFSVRGDNPTFAMARDSAADLSKPNKSPFALEANPYITMKMIQGDQEVPVRWNGDKGTTPTLEIPRDKIQPHKPVSFLLERTELDPNTKVGVVLKVNGLNTLFRETTPVALNCSKWVFSKPKQQLTVKGYQKSLNDIEEFKLLARSDFEVHKDKLTFFASELDKGYIDLTVFLESKSPLPPSMNNLEISLLNESQGLDTLAKDWDSARSQLAMEYNTLSIIVPGEKKEFKVEEVPFKSSTVPTMNVSIKYWEGALAKPK